MKTLYLITNDNNEVVDRYIEDCEHVLQPDNTITLRELVTALQIKIAKQSDLKGY